MNLEKDVIREGKSIPSTQSIEGKKRVAKLVSIRTLNCWGEVPTWMKVEKRLWIKVR